MADSPIQEWSLDDITERDVKTSEQLLAELDRWNQEYQNASKPKTTSAAPTQEELEMIRRFKEQGWI